MRLDPQLDTTSAPNSHCLLSRRFHHRRIAIKFQKEGQVCYSLPRGGSCWLGERGIRGEDFDLINLFSSVARPFFFEIYLFGSLIEGVKVSRALK